MSHPRQTISYLRGRLREVGIQPDKRHGQNFLVDLNLIDLLAEAAMLEPSDVVLEVGTGMGSLTSRMAPRVGHVVTVEIDAGLAQIAREELSGFSNVTLLQQDALRNKNQIHDGVRGAVEQQLDRVPRGCFKFVANLPYNIATPLISNLLHWEPPPSLMAVTIQKELADRILAVPGTKDYGAISVWVQSQCVAESIRSLPPSVFWPRPKVESAIIRILYQPEMRAKIVDLAFFHRFVRALFFHRRKFMRSVLASAFKHELDKSDVDEVLQRTGFSAQLRAEQLTVDEILTLCQGFEQLLARTRADD